MGKEIFKYDNRSDKQGRLYGDAGSTFKDIDLGEKHSSSRKKCREHPKEQTDTYTSTVSAAKSANFSIAASSTAAPKTASANSVQSSYQSPYTKEKCDTAILKFLAKKVNVSTKDDGSPIIKNEQQGVAFTNAVNAFKAKTDSGKAAELAGLSVNSQGNAIVSNGEEGKRYSVAIQTVKASSFSSERASGSTSNSNAAVSFSGNNTKDGCDRIILKYIASTVNISTKDNGSPIISSEQQGKTFTNAMRAFQAKTDLGKAAALAGLSVNSQGNAIISSNAEGARYSEAIKTVKTSSFCSDSTTSTSSAGYQYLSPSVTDSASEEARKLLGVGSVEEFIAKKCEVWKNGKLNINESNVRKYTDALYDFRKQSSSERALSISKIPKTLGGEPDIRSDINNAKKYNAAMELIQKDISKNIKNGTSFKIIDVYNCYNTDCVYTKGSAAKGEALSITPLRQYFLDELTKNYENSDYYAKKGHTIDAYLMIGICFGESGAYESIKNSFGELCSLESDEKNSSRERTINTLISSGIASSRDSAIGLMQKESFYQRAGDVLEHLDVGKKDNVDIRKNYECYNQAKKNADRWRTAVKNNSKEEGDYVFLYYKI